MLYGACPACARVAPARDAEAQSIDGADGRAGRALRAAQTRRIAGSHRRGGADLRVAPARVEGRRPRRARLAPRPPRQPATRRVDRGLSRQPSRLTRGSAARHLSGRTPTGRSRPPSSLYSAALLAILAG